MKQFIIIAVAASLISGGAAFAQAPADPAKGNAPLKPAHTVNDGGARQGANSFTEGQARRHIEKAGFTDVTSLSKGHDGVWRGRAMQNGQPIDIAMDFKGNVTTPTSAANGSSPVTQVAATTRDTTDSASTATSSTTVGPQTNLHHRRHRRHHHHGMTHAGHCANPGINGAACSGVDRNGNGISDKEDRAIKSGAKP